MVNIRIDEAYAHGVSVALQETGMSKQAADQEALEFTREVLLKVAEDEGMSPSDPKKGLSAAQLAAITGAGLGGGLAGGAGGFMAGGTAGLGLDALLSMSESKVPVAQGIGGIARNPAPLRTLRRTLTGAAAGLPIGALGGGALAAYLANRHFDEGNNPTE